MNTKTMARRVLLLEKKIRRCFLRCPLLFSRQSWKKIMKRIMSVFLALSLSITSLCVGFGVQKKEVQAIAGIDDAVYGFFWEICILFGALAGGYDRSEVLTPRESAGITDMPSAQQYVHDSFTSHPNWSKMFDLSDTVNVQFEQILAETYLTSSYVLNKELMNHLLDQYSQIPQRQPLVFEDLFTYVNSLVTLFPPTGDDDEEDDEEEEPSETAKPTIKPTTQPTSVPTIDPSIDILPNANSKVFPKELLPLAFKGVIFKLFFALAKLAVSHDMEHKLNPNLEDEEITYPIYSALWWKAFVSGEDYIGSMFFFTFYSPSFINAFNEKINLSGVGFGHEFYRALEVNNFSFYPLVFYKDNVPHFLIATDSSSNPSTALVDWFIHGFVTSPSLPGGSGSGVGYNKSIYSGFTLYDILGSNLSDEALRILNSSFKARHILNPSVLSINDEYLIDCNTEENAKKFQELIQSGTYSYEDILALMADGWKGLKTATWTGVEDEGETAKKVMESEKGKKYTQTGQGKDSSGKTKPQVGINIDSIVAGLEAQVPGNTGASAEELLGEVTHGNPLNVPQTETFPNPNPGDGTETNPSPNPGTGTETNPSPNPGSSTETNPNPGNDTENSPTPEESTKPYTEPIQPSENDVQWYERFPFCVPWDLYNAVTNLKAKTKVPVFKIPFKYERLNVDETIIIDFSDYEKLAVILRWFLRLIFLAGLIMISRYLIKG